MGYVNFYDRKIDLSAKYEVFFSDLKRDITPEQLAKYERIKMWPVRLQDRLLAKLPPECNPNIFIMTGQQLVDFATSHKYIPVFDTFFITSRRLTLMPGSAIDIYLEHSKKIGKG